MAEYSIYKSLELPSSTEHYNIGVFNNNAMVIDSELHKLDLINESLSNHTSDELNPHKVKKSQIGLSNVDNTSDINKPVSTAQQTAIDEALYQSNCYTDIKIAELINGAPETLDTLKEVADAIEEDKTIVEVLDAAIGTKANQNELNTHINNDVIHITQSDKNNLNTAKEHTDSQHARADATKVEKSDINGNIKINGVETNVYTLPSSTKLPLTTSLDATEEGVAALDSTVGKVLKDEIDELNNNLGGNNLIYSESEDAYYIQHGADAALKKLGSSELVEVSLPYTADGDYPAVAFVVPFVPTGHGLAQPSGGYGEIMDVTANKIVVRGSEFVGNINLPSTSISPAAAITYVEKGHRYTVKNSATANAQIYAYLYILK